MLALVESGGECPLAVIRASRITEDGDGSTKAIQTFPSAEQFAASGWLCTCTGIRAEWSALDAAYCQTRNGGKRELPSSGCTSLKRAPLLRELIAVRLTGRWRLDTSSIVLYK